MPAIYLNEDGTYEAIFRIRDDSLLSMESVQEDINTRLLMSRLAETDSPGKPEKKGFFGRQTTRTPVKHGEKTYNGELIRKEPAK